MSAAADEKESDSGAAPGVWSRDMGDPSPVTLGALPPIGTWSPRVVSSTPAAAPDLGLARGLEVEDQHRAEPPGNHWCAQAGAVPKTAPVQSPHEEELAAIRDTCRYAERAMRGLNERLGSAHLDQDVKEVIRGTNRVLLGICSGRSRQHLDSEGSSDEDRPRQAPQRRLDFSEPIVKPEPCSSALPEKLDSTALLEALTRLDNRSVPRPEAFNLESGQPFEEFTALFEEYCSCTFRGSSTLWISELGRLLSGELKRAFDALKAPGDTYPAVKQKLAAWVDNRREKVQLDTKSRFSAAKLEVGETCSLFAARLEKLFRLAHPRRNAETSDALRRKYLNSLPDDFLSELQTAINLTKSMTSENMTWSKILLHTTQYEISSARRRCDSTGGDMAALACQAPTGDPRYGPPRPGDAEVAQNTGATGHLPARPSRPPGRRPTVDDRTYSQAWSPPRRETQTCHYCSREGHLRRDCRRLMNQCFLCGSPNHRIAQCPDRRESRQVDAAATVPAPRPAARDEPQAGTAEADMSRPGGLTSALERAGGRPGNGRASW